MMNRINVQQSQPEAYNAMFQLEKYLESSTIEKDLQEIVRIRASIINQCHFCIGMHTEAAFKLGITKEKILALSSWQDSNVFNDKECAVLAMTDCMTNIKEQGIPDGVYQIAATFFTENEIAQLIMLNVTINAWNRIGIASSVS
jgi:AhpD family alkylhydroperoxidase